MFGSKSFDKSLTLNSYKSTISLFTKMANDAIRSAYGDDEFKRRARDLAAKTKDILADDYDKIVLVLPDMKDWMKECKQVRSEFQEQMKDNISLIITFYFDKALFVLKDCPPNERYEHLVVAEAAMHRWQDKLSRLVPEEITESEVRYIKTVAQAMIRGDL